MKQPQRLYAYKNLYADSSRWDGLVPRRDDIVIATAYKSGTTWMQTIVANLVFPDGNIPGPVTEISPWLDMRILPLQEILDMLEAQRHRRFIKTHQPLDALPFYEGVKYVMVGRDPRDVAMSMLNHHNNYTPEILEAFNAFAQNEADRAPAPFPDARTFWRAHMTRGTTPWEQDGWPYWSQLRYAQSWWDFRDQPNILMVHYNDLLADLEGEIRRVASFLDIAHTDALIARAAEATTFTAMKARASEIVPVAEMAWKGGAQTFIHKGTNGRWREHFDAADHALYEEAAGRVLSPDCRAWLEHGRLALSSQPAAA